MWLLELNFQLRSNWGKDKWGANLRTSDGQEGNKSLGIMQNPNPKQKTVQNTGKPFGKLVVESITFQVGVHAVATRTKKIDAKIWLQYSSPEHSCSWTQNEANASWLPCAKLVEDLKSQLLQSLRQRVTKGCYGNLWACSSFSKQFVFHVLSFVMFCHVCRLAFAGSTKACCVQGALFFFLLATTDSREKMPFILMHFNTACVQERCWFRFGAVIIPCHYLFCFMLFLSCLEDSAVNFCWWKVETLLYYMFHCFPSLWILAAKHAHVLERSRKN